MTASLGAFVRRLSDTALGGRLKAALGVRVPKQLRPFSSSATVSDVFPWRVDDEWETRFDLMNLPALLAPERVPRDDIDVRIYDHAGREIHRRVVVLDGAVSQPLILGDMIDGHKGAGTFALFHWSSVLPGLLAPSRTHLTERGYLALRRRGDPLWSYVHGNTYALAKAPDSDAPSSVTGHGRGPYPYRPQLRLDDCDRFELLHVNPCDRGAGLEVRLTDLDGNRIDCRNAHVPARGIETIKVDNRNRRVALVDIVGDVEDWRPIVIKHYDSHFNILHS